MNETERIADQIERCWSGPAWHGPSLREVLDGVSAAQAGQRPIENAHSIWELVLHSAAWAVAALRSLESGQTVLSDDENFPGVSVFASEAWEQAKAKVERTHLELARAVGKLDDRDLTRTVRGMHETYSIYVLLHGLVQHSTYHGGQMMLLKKALPATPPGGAMHQD